MVVLDDEQAALAVFTLVVGKRGLRFGQERRLRLRCSGYPLLGFVAYRHAEVEHRAFAHRALRRHRSAHGIHNLLHECKPHACADALGIAFALIERLEDMGERFRGHTLSRVLHVDEELFAFAPHRHAHLAVFGRELEGIGKQVVDNLVYIVRNKVHLHRVLGKELQVDVSAAGIVAPTFNYHREIGGDIAVTPIGIAHRRLEFRDVQELVDEREQAMTLPLDG